jgi:hypothetical protein
MKKLAVLSLVLIFCLSQFVFADETRQLDKVNWEAFSKNIVKGLSIDNDGVKQAALQHIVNYGEYLNVDKAVFDIVNIYRNSKNEKFRQLAVIALHKMHNEWAMNFLQENLRLETNPAIKKQIVSCFYQHQQELLAKNNKKNSTNTVKLIAENQ